MATHTSAQIAAALPDDMRGGTSPADWAQSYSHSRPAYTQHGEIDARRRARGHGDERATFSASSRRSTRPSCSTTASSTKRRARSNLAARGSRSGDRRPRSYARAVRLFHVPGRQERAAEAADPQGHLAQLPARREDRHPRLNGAGKSTVLRIMAGVDTDIDGDAMPMPGITHRLPASKSRSSIRTRPCARRSRKALSELIAARKRLDEIYAAYGEPDADFDKLAEEQAKLEAVLFSQGGDDIEQQLEIAADALRLPPWDAHDRTALGRREAPRRAVPAAAVETRHAAARRADEPSRRRERRVARAVPAALPRHRRRGDARPLLPRQRRGVDPRARPRPRHPVEGQLQLLARSEAGAARRRKKRRSRRGSKALKRELEWVRSGAKARQSKSKSRIARFEELSSYEYQRRNETQEIFIPVAERLGDQVIEFDGVRKAYGDRLLMDDVDVHDPGRRDRRHHRPERRRQDRRCSA